LDYGHTLYGLDFRGYVMQYYHMECDDGGAFCRNDRQKALTKNVINSERKVECANEVLPRIKVDLYRNKWQQLLNDYPQVHIIAEAESILIKPKDAVVLSEEYHNLSTNSFLLHAYYNYRQLLLFRYLISEKYYIGVPGIYNERQQRIAMMFGFEAFESLSNNLEPFDTYGYFMKSVEI
jgi:hypothetical protein